VPTADVVLVIVDLLDQETGPSGSHDSTPQPEPGSVVWQTALSCALNAGNEPKCRSISSASDSSGPAAPVRRQVAPRVRVQHVAGKVEREIALELRDRVVASTAAGFGRDRRRPCSPPFNVTRVLRVVVQGRSSRSIARARMRSSGSRAGTGASTASRDWSSPPRSFRSAPNPSLGKTSRSPRGAATE